MRLSKTAKRALNDAVRTALRVRCVVRVNAPSVRRAYEIFEAIEPHLVEFGAKPHQSMLLFEFRNDSQIRIVIDGGEDP